MPEFQRYEKSSNCGIVMSQSTMHSIKKLIDTAGFDPFTRYVTKETREQVRKNYEYWLQCKELVKKEATGAEKEVFTKKEYEALMILLHNLPRGLELWVTVTTNYLQLKTQVIQRAHHKQIEDWGNFISSCYSLPRFRELCGFEDEKWDIENLFSISPLAFEVEQYLES